MPERTNFTRMVRSPKLSFISCAASIKMGLNRTFAAPGPNGHFSSSTRDPGQLCSRKLSFLLTSDSNTIKSTEGMLTGPEHTVLLQQIVRNILTHAGYPTYILGTL